MPHSDDLVDADFGNLSLLEDLYQKYIQDPKSVDNSWHSYFNQLDSEINPSPFPQIDRSAPANLRIYHLIVAYRTYGHL